MAKRLSESVKLIEKGFRRKVKKERWEQTTPSFRNLNIETHYKNDYDNIRVSITDLLDIEDTRIIVTKISNISPYGSNYVISNIECPTCRKQIKLNRHWNCYICECPEHDKKIFEIKDVVYPKPKKIIELPSDDYE